ncbi:MAG TPA: helicase C-terminal domain-containing protein [Polyangia bacterium]|jgi:ATP-dependent DNA helicase DinG|nr:helicase C-terminal domain-containing protein [Polyangia bacterium]
MIREVLGPGGLVASALPGYESRPGQLAMAERIAEALKRDDRLLVEAGTGTGKTLAYLVPALLSGRKVVISTGTKTLQDQIATVDLPRLQQILTGVLSPALGFESGRDDAGNAPPPPFTWAVMKGLGNYVCLRRLGEQQRQLSLTPTPELDRILAFAGESATGDRADLLDLPDDAPLWREIAATPETRIGPRCAYFERCFVTGMRRRAAEAQLVVVNHHLFFADLALRSQWPEAQVLPPYEVVIFDEAHQIEEIATEFFGLHVSTQRLFALARDVGRAARLPAQRAHSAATRLQGAAAALADALRDRLPAPRPGTDEVRVPMPDDLWTGVPLRRYHELDTILEEVGAWLAFDGEAVRDANSDGNQAPEIAGLGRRANALRAELGGLVDVANREHVRWIAGTPRNVSLHTSPIDVGPALARAFDLCPGPIIFTSATLSVAGSFSYLRERLGLQDAASEATYPSPFRYHQQALLYVAADLPEPNDERFPLAAAERAGALCQIAGGRALLLFTSFRNLRVAEAYLRATLPFPLLVQGERPRHRLLAELRARVGSVLLATQSFWEGVDVPGDALSLVVMDRIPFAVPDDPLTAARISHIRAQGGDPFGGFQLPRAALSLKQGFGRLIRSHADTGVVALLDGRIARRPYGATLYASLPRDCPRTESLDDVALFFARSVRPAAPAPAAAVEPA